MAIYLGNQMIGMNITPALQNGIIRPDAELIATYTNDYMAITEGGITIPEWSTSSQTLLASVNLSPTIAITPATYNYYVLERLLTIPTYSITTLAKGREEYQFSSYLYELFEIPANEGVALVNGKILTTANYGCAGQGLIRQLYWSSASAIAWYGATTYGLSQVIAAPTTTATVLTLKAPSITIRGNATQLAQTFYEAITDFRVQYVIDVYRAPKNRLNIDGWGITQEAAKIINCINNNNCNLT